MPDELIALLREMPGVLETLQAGADVLTVGYPQPQALTRTARAFPRSCFTALGVPSGPPARGRGNLRFLPGLEALATGAEFDLVAAGTPVTRRELRALTALLKPGGVLVRVGGTA